MADPVQLEMEKRANDLAHPDHTSYGRAIPGCSYFDRESKNSSGIWSTETGEFVAPVP